MLLLFLVWISESNEHANYSDWAFSSSLTNSKFDKNIFSCHAPSQVHSIFLIGKCILKSRVKKLLEVDSEGSKFHL